jgi:hypothetical protein
MGIKMEKHKINGKNPIKNRVKRNKRIKKIAIPPK